MSVEKPCCARKARCVRYNRVRFPTTFMVVSVVFLTISTIWSMPSNAQTLDGVLDHGEYNLHAAFGGGDYKIYWSINDTTIYIGITARTSGWVALGIEPTARMKDADIIFGWVTDDGNVSVLDCYSTGETGPHPPDTELGGTSDILEYGGSENNGFTTIEFSRKLSTGDAYDKDIPFDSEMNIIWAIGSSDDFNEKHSKNGYGTLNTTSGDGFEQEVTPSWLFHAGLMTTGFLFMVSGAAIARSMRQKRWWLKAHKAIGASGASFAVIGLFTALYMISVSTGEHLRVPHAYLGSITIIFVLMTPALGIMQFKAKTGRIRTMHRAFGGITIGLVLFTIISGLLQAGII